MRAPVTDIPVAFDAVSLRAGEVEIVRALSLNFAAGAPTVLLGPNGSGKSTLLRLAMGLARANVRAHHMGRTRRAGRAARHDVPAPRDAAADRGRQCRLCAAGARTIRAWPSC